MQQDEKEEKIMDPDFILPMMASPMPKDSYHLFRGNYYAEEKIDGHRLIVSVYRDQPPKAWSRNAIARVLPPHLLEPVSKLNPGTYDGELHVPGLRSYGVTEIVNNDKLVFTVFDVLNLRDTETVPMFALPYEERRKVLQMTVGHLESDYVKIASSVLVEGRLHLDSILAEIWGRDGEGVILKLKDSTYSPGKRPKNAWVKIKQLNSAALTVLGFIPSRGEIDYRGLYAMTVLQDGTGNVTVVKTRNDEECRHLEQEAPKGELAWRDIRLPDRGKITYHIGAKVDLGFSLGEDKATLHPRVGTKLRIEFQERTPDGGYRHPRWDRWEDQ
jgi:ATP-dependent DNA ligase